MVRVAHARHAKGPGAQLNARSDDIGIGHGVAQTKAHDGNITAGGSWFEGIIDEVWILNTPLTESELMLMVFNPLMAWMGQRSVTKDYIALKSMLESRD